MSRLWFAMVEVEPTDGNTAFEDADQGAFVNAVGSAKDKDEFIALLERRLEREFMKLVHIDELQPLDERPRWDESEQLRYIVSFIKEDRQVVLGDIYFFEQD